MNVLPDEIPLWFGIPGGIVLTAIYIAIRIAEERDKLRRIRAQFAHPDDDNS